MLAYETLGLLTLKSMRAGCLLEKEYIDCRQTVC